MRHDARILLALTAVFALATTTAGAAPKGRPHWPSRDQSAKNRAKSGERIYTENCSYCHGAAGRGDGPNASKLDPRPTDLTASAADETAIAGVVRNGKGSCPSWRASLSEDEIAAVAKWAKGLQGGT